MNPFSDDTEPTVDESEITVMTADNAEQMLSCLPKLFLFPADGKGKREGFYVVHATLGRVQRFQKAIKSASDQMQLSEMCKLIAETVVDQVGNPVFTTQALEQLAKARTDRFLFIQKAVASHNGLSGDADRVEAMIEAAGKN